VADIDPGHGDLVDPADPAEGLAGVVLADGIGAES
jgi:hypothetical protein